jgi:hypothetical protein
VTYKGTSQFTSLLLKESFERDLRLFVDLLEKLKLEHRLTNDVSLTVITDGGRKELVINGFIPDHVTVYDYPDKKK